MRCYLKGILVKKIYNYSNAKLNSLQAYNLNIFLIVYQQKLVYETIKNKKAKINYYDYG